MDILHQPKNSCEVEVRARLPWGEENQDQARRQSKPPFQFRLCAFLFPGLMPLARALSITSTLPAAYQSHHVIEKTQTISLQSDPSIPEVLSHSYLELSCIADSRRQNLAPPTNRYCLFPQIAYPKDSASRLQFLTSMLEPSASVSSQASSYVEDSIATSQKTIFVGDKSVNILLQGIQRRWRRDRRRRKVGRAYDMALEIANVVPANSRILDVGCGNGFIAHHLSAMLDTNVTGIDLEPATEAAIDYRQFDGKHFPVADGSIDAVLLCYVLHHAQELDAMMSELRRVLSADGVVVIYEDIPDAWLDRLVCWTHNLKWEKRTGKCAFRSDLEWCTLFISAGFEIVTQRSLSRWRNLTHPVRRKFFLAKLSESGRRNDRR